MEKPIILNDKTAVKITAKIKWTSDKANLYDCEGDEVWVPHKVCEFNDREKTLIIEKWFYDKLVAEGKL